MKKKHLRMFRRILAGAAILTILVPVRAQVSNPSEWSGFVEGSGNTLVVDTFRMQTFHGLPGDNWNYSSTGGVSVPEGKNTLMIPVGSSVSFVPFPTSVYEDVVLRLYYAGDKLVPKENLELNYFRNDVLQSKVLFSPQKIDDYFNYQFALVEDSPSSLTLKAIGPAKNTMNGYYLAKSVCAYGNIPCYSLFSGDGYWNDTIRWSHLPPLRHRCALINGAVIVNSSINCQTASLGNGSLNITEGGHLTVDTLFLYNTDFSLIVQSELSIKKNITLQYTFPEKGKWYFLSFPFDVSLKGIDNRFRLKDNLFSGSGNYLYIQRYDGDKRASTQKPTGNWEVFPEPASSGNPLVFEKGKGYLVALDVAASANTLTFSADKGNIPDSFGKTASIPINISSLGDAGSSHNGWYLCGNPLPSPLSLSQIEPDPALDGNIYLYDGNTYKPYLIGSNYALPPLTAFFVKATAATELAITSEPSAANAILLKSGFSLRSGLAEPTGIKTQIFQAEKEIGKSILKGNTLYLEDIPYAGNVKVMDVAGRLVYSHAVPNGSSRLSLSLRSGLYIIIVEADGYRAQHKCVLTQ